MRDIISGFKVLILLNEKSSPAQIYSIYTVFPGLKTHTFFKRFLKGWHTFDTLGLLSNFEYLSASNARLTIVQVLSL